MLTTRGQKSSTKATLYISWVAATGLTVFAAALTPWQSTGMGRFVAFLFVAQLVSTQKISLPGMRGTISPSFLFMLIGIAEFSLPETLVLGCAADEVRMGMRVSARWRPREEWDTTLGNIDHFRPTGEPGSDDDGWRDGERGEFLSASGDCQFRPEQRGARDAGWDFGGEFH